MKKLVVLLIAVAVVAGVLGTTGVVYAQGGNPPVTAPGNGAGQMGPRGGMYVTGQTGPLHDATMTAWAEKLGMSVDDLNAQIASGKTLYQIALDQGYTFEQFRTWMIEVRDQVNAQLAEQGITLPGGGPRYGNNSQAGQGLGVQDCPYYDGSAPAPRGPRGNWQ